MKKIGWIGVGIMDKSMVRNLMKVGFELHIYARTKAKMEDVIHREATFHETIRNYVEGCKAIITMVGFLRDVEEVYFAENSISNSAGVGAHPIDMTTTSPALAKRLSETGITRGYHIINAPIIGGGRSTRSETLSIMVGGEQKGYEACLSLLQAMGKNTHCHGKAGCGQHAKLMNQIIIAGTLSGIYGTLAYAKAQGLDLQMVFDSVSTGSAANRQLSSFALKMMDGDYVPRSFLKHFVRDMKFVLEEVDAVGLDLAVLWWTLSDSKKLEGARYGDLDMQALIKHYK